MPDSFVNQHPCSLCQNDAFAEMANPKLSHLCRCLTCGVVCVKRYPPEEELRAIYGETYFKNDESAVMGYDDYEQDRANILRTAARRLREIERRVPPGRLLDVGCALGFFLDEARRRGWTVEGIDISAHAARYAREKLDLPARSGLLRDAGFAKESFDVITMWDVIEHVRDPVAELSLCRDLLRPGGLVVLSTPDAGSPVARVTGARWMGYKLAEEHLYYFSRKTMTFALEKAGFQTQEIAGIGKDIDLAFFAKRLSMYTPRLAGALSHTLQRLHLEAKTLYVNPRDIMRVVARRN